MQNQNYTKPSSKDKLITGLITMLMGGLLFFWGINAAKENSTGGGRLIIGMLLFSFGICAVGDIGKEEKPQEISLGKDYASELLKELNKHLQTGEKIKEHLTFVEVKASSFVKDQYLGLAAATNKRIIIYKTKLGGHKLKSLNYTKVSAIEHEEGLLFDSLEFSTSGEQLSIDKINKGNTAKFLNYVNSKI